MKRFISKKVAIVGGAAALIVALSGAAYAYFTATGTGTGTAQVGYATNWKITSTPGSGTLYPDASIGGANQESVGFSVTNEGKGDQNLAALYVIVANSDGSPWSYQPNPNEPACTGADFSVGGAPVGTPYEITSGGGIGTYTPGQTANGSVSVEMIDNGANQDNCQGLSVPLYFSTNPALAIDAHPSPASVAVGSNVSITTDAFQNYNENSTGSEAFTFNNTYLSFVSAGDGTCTANTSGVNTTETCTMTDMAHSIKSDSFTFKALQAGSTTVNVVISITGSGSATTTFTVNAS